MLLAHTLGQLSDLAAAVTPSPAPKPIDDDKVSPGWIGLGLLVAMGIAVVFLVRSMQARLRNIDVDRHRREQEAKGQADGNVAPAPIADDGPETDKT
jgi:hypothetical protein